MKLVTIFLKRDEKKDFLTLILQFISIFALYLYVIRTNIIKMKELDRVTEECQTWFLREGKIKHPSLTQ